jgi:peptidoglycan/xylan/chitin deacetylase (PgdA/CDA1 family)
MIDVYLTVDVEVWCDDWGDIDRGFAEAFRRYVYGPTPVGDYGLPLQVRMLQDHGLRATFFVESLFAGRFGAAPLAEIVGLLAEGGQDAQLHLHPEWALEDRFPAVLPYPGRRPGLRQFSLDDQVRLLRRGLQLLAEAGQPAVRAFRAGSFAFNTDTLRALHELGIAVDASYNASYGGSDSGLRCGELLTQPLCAEGVWELPMTVFRDGLGKLRHLHLTACSVKEMEGVFMRAAEDEQRALVVLWHGFELLNVAKDLPDPVVLDRFKWLCTFLNRHRDTFRVRHFDTFEPYTDELQPAPIACSLLPTARRLFEQARRRSYG